MPFTKNQRNGLIATVAALAVGQGVLQGLIDPLRRQPAIEPVKKEVWQQTTTSLPFEYSLAALSGFRQVIAGLLWVRTDAFFHSGNYDAILPMIRLITWLDPNWLDVYATGAWHLMYNFTDTDQRSDRRYLAPGLALLDEGIANNPNVYDVYKEKGWNNYDKIKDYNAAIEAYQGAMANDPKADVTQVQHALAHSYERAGRIDEAIAAWKKAVELHQAIMDDPKASQEAKGRARSGLASSQRNLEHIQLRKILRVDNVKPPVDAQFGVTVTRIKPRVLEVRGHWNLVGTRGKAFDMGSLEKPGKGILLAGPVDGARVDVRLQDQGYTMPKLKEFNANIDESVTIMQDQLSTRGGKMAKKGELYVAAGKYAGSVDRNAENTGVYAFEDPEVAKFNLGTVPLSKGLGQLNAQGQLQAVSVAYPLPYGAEKIVYSPADVPALFAKLKTDTAKLAELDKKNYRVAQADAYQLGEYKREIDMSKDPKMYSFSRDKYDLIVSFNPRSAPDFVKDRIGWSGEGLTDKRYLDTKTMPGNRMIRNVITLTRDDITGDGKKVLYTDEGAAAK
jgi:tetratricopeptide (TPR) repeat protein